MKTTQQCGWCFNIFEREPRTLVELEELRKTLFITGPSATVDLPICDGCYGQVIGSATSSLGELPVGKSNSGPPNVLLRMGGGN